MKNVFQNQKQTANQIKTLRWNGGIEQAIEICRQATKQYPEDNFFFKILGDLQYDCSLYREALHSYIEFALRIWERAYLIANLFRFVNKLRNTPNSPIADSVLRCQFLELLDNDLLSMESRIKLVEYLSSTFVFPNNKAIETIRLLENPKESSKVKEFINKTNQQALYIFFFVLGQQLKLSDFKISKNNYKMVASSMEKKYFHCIALSLTQKMLEATQDGVVVRTLFRLCRQLGNYAIADRYIEEHPHIIQQGDFNIQYELVYYFKKKKNQALLLQSLSKIRDSAQKSQAISKTLYNFYVQFEMLSEASDMIAHMEKLNQKRRKNRQPAKWEDAANETDEGVWEMLRNIVSEKEHNRQLIATKDLMKGFSHELGQPLTNIRYDIGFYFMKKKYGQSEENDIDETLNNILRQISRIDKLLKRFSPIFSSKSKNIRFQVTDEIQTVFDEMSSRLKSHHIQYSLTGGHAAQLRGDPLKFHQIFYNLIINSIHSIQESGIPGNVSCAVYAFPNKIMVKFSDNGKGIPISLANKIFEPFFSTKQKKKSLTQDEGGEGLGLFIVWNIVKMFNGAIHINNDYKNGAQFILEFVKEKRGSSCITS